MFCKNCGKEINPNAATCIQCGFANGAGNNFCRNCGHPLQPGSGFCTNCGAVQANPVQRSKLVAVLLAFFLGAIGMHDFYLGNTTNGVIKIVLTLCTGVGGYIWALVDLIRLLTDVIHTDANGVELKKEF